MKKFEVFLNFFFSVTFVLKVLSLQHKHIHFKEFKSSFLFFDRKPLYLNTKGFSETSVQTLCFFIEAAGAQARTLIYTFNLALASFHTSQSSCLSNLPIQTLPVFCIIKYYIETIIIHPMRAYLSLYWEKSLSMLNICSVTFIFVPHILVLYSLTAQCYAELSYPSHCEHMCCVCICVMYDIPAPGGFYSVRSHTALCVI